MLPEDLPLAKPSAEDWLLGMLRAHLAGSSSAPQAESPADLSELAVAEGLAGLAAEYVLPRDRAYAALVEKRLHQFAFASKLVEVQRALGRALSSAGLKVLLLKGAALLEGPYREAKGRRPLSDLDLLVRPSQAARLREVFLALGLRPLDRTRWRGDGFEIDLHFDLLGLEGQGLERLSPFEVDEEALWQRSLPAREGGPALRVLTTEDQLLHLAVHAQKHAFCRLVWLLDLALLLPRANARALAEEARAWRAERALAAALFLLEHLLGQGIPLALEPLLLRLGGLERAWLSLIAERGAGSRIGLGRLIAGLALPTWPQRLRYGVGLLLPGARVLGRRYPRRTRLGAATRFVRVSLLPRLTEILRLMTWSFLSASWKAETAKCAEKASIRG